MVNTAEEREATVLDGQVAIITGGGGIIGRAITRELARAGMKVAVVGRSAEPLREAVQLIRSTGGSAAAYMADVTDFDAVQRAVESVTRDLGPVDLLVNNAGIVGDTLDSGLWEQDPRRWWGAVQTNLGGTFICSLAVLKQMVRLGRGRIVNVATSDGVKSRPYAISYSASKAAVLRFTDSLAEETRDVGVKVFAISPGTVRSPLTEYARATEERRAKLGIPAAGAQAWTDPKRAGELVVLLASGGADELSGRYIRVADDIQEFIRRVRAVREREEAEGLKWIRVLRMLDLDGQSLV
jgi:NAD(P)-dependent dehydrogenase (short-subunit alcohol dehydrogenase family)